jgi:hypothetical protein
MSLARAPRMRRLAICLFVLAAGCNRVEVPDQPEPAPTPEPEGTFIGVADGRIAWSADGQTWIEATLPEGVTIDSMIVKDGSVIAVGETIALSTDLRTWQTAPGLEPYHWHAIAESDGTLVAVGDAYEPFRAGVVRSTDGVTWSFDDIELAAAFVSVAAHDGTLAAVAVGTIPETGGEQLPTSVWAYSPADGWTLETTWTRTGCYCDPRYNLVVRGDGGYAALGGVISSARDGVEWAPVELEKETWQEVWISYAAYANGRYLGLDVAGGVLVGAADGSSFTWHEAEPDESFQPRGLTVRGDRFYAASVIECPPGGGSWDDIEPQCDKGLFVSDDGLSWEQVGDAPFAFDHLFWFDDLTVPSS